MNERTRSPNCILLLFFVILLLPLVGIAETETLHKNIYVPENTPNEWTFKSAEGKIVLKQKYEANSARITDNKKRVYELIIQTDITKPGYELSYGSGVVFDHNGILIIITASHVVSDADGVPRIIHARDYAGRLFRCRTLKRISWRDIAILEVLEPERILPETIVHSLGSATIGDNVYACGYYQGSPFVKMGKITGVGGLRWPEDSGLIFDTIETDAQIGHGFSGGPALNEAGELIGIVIMSNYGYTRSDLSSYNNIRKILKYIR